MISSGYRIVAIICPSQGRDESSILSTRTKILTFHHAYAIMKGYATKWGVSSVGRARHSHCRGREFDSRTLHQKKRLLCEVVFVLRFLPLSLLVTLQLLTFS